MTALKRQAERLSSWPGRLDTMLRLQAFGSEELETSLHESLPDPERPGYCVIDGLELDDPLHDRHLRRRRAARREPGTLVTERGWR